MQFEKIPPLSLLAGNHLIEVTKGDYDWVFQFADDITVVVESHWRLVEGQRVVVADEDHAQLFGLNEPVDAANVLYLELEGATVSGVGLSTVSDLLLSFSNGRTLQVLISSAGYESWHAYGGDSHTFARGGGELCRFVR